MELFSCSADGSVKNWINSSKDPYDYNNWKLHSSYLGTEQKTSINCLSTLFISQHEKYFACFNSNGRLDIFNHIENVSYQHYHSIVFKKKLQDAICLTLLNEDSLILFTGGYDNLIHIYNVQRSTITLPEGKLNDHEVCSLKLSISGHTNDIRDIQALNPQLDFTKEFFIASCSQDSYIRLWHVVELDKAHLKQMQELKLNEKGSLSIFEEYKSKTSYVLKSSGNKDDRYYNIILDSVLSGHEEAISSVRWGYLNNNYESPVLISSSFDFTVSIWKYDEKYVILNLKIASLE
jgi:WD40 repeat protein